MAVNFKCCREFAVKSSSMVHGTGLMAWRAWLRARRAGRAACMGVTAVSAPRPHDIPPR